MESIKCKYCIAPENGGGKLKKVTAEIYDNRIDVFKKSAWVTILFGAIGSAIEGKGSLDATISSEIVTAYRVDGKNYFLYLQDGNVATFNVSDKNANAMTNFLAGKPVK